jgi:hypothetical protein
MVPRYMFTQGYNVPGQIVTNRANNGAFLNLTSVTFKSRSIENQGIMSCILIRFTYDKNLEMIQPLVQEL